jgi:RimJ/RimL family protein N-acetyltransferase
VGASRRSGGVDSSTVVVVVAVVRDGVDGWLALRDGVVVGRLRALVRPDQRCFLLLDRFEGDVYRQLVAGALSELDREVYLEVDEGAVDVQTVLAELGFTVHRREHRYLVPTDLSAVPGSSALPGGFGVISAAAADVHRWRELDDALRQEVPGAAGWRNDPYEFARQTFDDPQFDPATYLLAVEEGGGYVGLVRVWNRPDVPRLGLIGVLPSHRRRGLATALIAAVFNMLHGRGQPQVSCEVDETNTASNTLMRRLGARRVGGGVELVRCAHRS